MGVFPRGQISPRMAVMNLKILHEVCSLPTAPFREQAVIAYARSFARQRGLKVTQDAQGNVMLELAGRKRRPRWVFAAHMDHPGFVAVKMLDAHTLLAAFRGWVLAELIGGERVRFCGKEGEIAGKVVKVRPWKYSPRAGSAEIRVEGKVAANTPGMFDQGLGRVKGKIFYSRAIDDLGGVAAALAMLDELSRSKSARPQGPVVALLTRAEEDGFGGAIAAALNRRMLGKSDRIIAIECSAQQAYARQGDGCIIRIGDKTSIFNSGLSYFLTQQARELAKTDKTFRYQRALMPGGTCEATVYDAFGLQAAAACVPLGNYHNMDQKRKKIGPEYIDINDWRNMTKLFVRIARRGHEYEEGHKALRAGFMDRYNWFKRLLAADAKPAASSDDGKRPT